MSVIAIIAITLLLVIFAVVKPIWLAYSAVFIGGIPLMIFVGDIQLLDFIGGVNVQAAMLFVFLISTTLALLMRVACGLKIATTHYFFMAFIFYCLFSMLAWSSGIYGIRMFVKLIYPFMFFVFIYCVFRGTGKEKNLENIYYISILISISLALLNTFSSGMLAPLKGTYGLLGLPSLSAPYMSPANFSFFLSVGGLLAFSRWMVDRRVIYLLIYLVVSIAIVMAFVRIGILAFFFGSSVIYFLQGRAKYIKPVISVFLVVSVIGSFFYLDTLKDRMFYDPERVRYSDLIENPGRFIDNLNTSGRAELWKNAHEHFEEESALSGAGIGSVDNWLTEFSYVNALHSDYYRLFLDLGWLGLFLYIAAMLHMLQKCFSGYSRTRTQAYLKDSSIYFSVSIAAFLGMLVTILTDNTLNYVTEYGIYVYSMPALAYSALSLKMKR